MRTLFHRQTDEDYPTVSAYSPPMRRFLSLLAVVALACPGLLAHTGGKVKLQCPLDGKTFKAWQDFSGSSFAQRLDLKQLGATVSPWTLAQCPKCHFPIYRENLSPEEKAELKQVVKSPEFLNAVNSGSSYAALAVVQEKTGAKPFLIAQSYLQASWQLEDKDTYEAAANAAIRWFDAAEPKLRDSEHEDTYLTSCYIPIELLRRIGQFSAASARLKTFPMNRLLPSSALTQALARQRRLIAAHDRSSDESYSWGTVDKDRPAIPKRQDGLTASNDVERQLLADAKRISAVCVYYALSHDVSKVEITHDQASGRIGPDPQETDVRISPGTELVDNVWDAGGSFSLRRADAFGGQEIVFDEAGAP